MTPEEQVRTYIDRHLNEAGWRVVNRSEFVTDEAIAVREVLLQGNDEADYILFVMGKAVGVIEAKKEEIDVNTPKVIAQAEGYAHKLLPWCQAWQDPLPLVWLSNGKQCFFRDLRDTTQTEYKEINRFHTPKEITRLLGINAPYAGLPMVEARGLRDCQYEGIVNLEKSLKEGRKRALMVLATGAGKTYLAITAIYRLLTYTPCHRVLFYNRQNERCTFCKTKGTQKIQLHSNRGGHQIGVRLCYLYVPFEYVFSSSNTIQTLIEQFIYTLHIEYKLDIFFTLQEAERVEEVAFIDVHIA